MEESMVVEQTRDYDKDFLRRVSTWKIDAEENLKQRYSTWAENIRRIKGIFPQDEQSRSKVRNRSKIFWRKTWATAWRILATFYQVFLKEDSIKIQGRSGLDNDVLRAKVLTEMVKYRRDLMNRKGNLFVKLLWAFLDILYLGNAVGKLRWVKTETRDEPELVIYPPEDVFFDPYATCEDDMKYIIFQTYLIMDDLIEEGYQNLDEVKPASVSDNIVKQAREFGKSSIIKPPLSVDSNYYPPDGSGEPGGSTTGKRYRVWEVLWKKEGVIWYAVTNENHSILEYPKETPFDIYPAFIGACLLEPHSLLAEGFPEPMSGPQESANATLNMRKDAVALSLAPHRLVSRFAGVDIQSLVNSRVGGITFADDINGVKTEEMRDVTQKAYIEVDQDDLMMQEMSGITAQREGLVGTPGEKATVANIRYQESGTKLDLYISIVSETFVKKFFYLLAYFIQKFETNETIFRVANASLREENPQAPEIWTIDSFEADYIIEVGTDVLSKQQQLNSALMAMDRATAANAAIFQLIQIGAIPPDKAEIFSVSKFMNDVLPLMGFKNVKDYIIKLQPPQNPMAVSGMPSPPRQLTPGAING